jgi:hypothetical protein
MPHITVANATSAVSIQPGAIVSKVIHRVGDHHLIEALP